MLFKIRAPGKFRPSLISLIDVIFLLLIFFVITSLLSFQGGSLGYKEANISLHLKEVSGGGEVAIETPANFIVYLYESNNDIKYILLHMNIGPEGVERQSYRSLIANNLIPRVLEEPDVAFYSQDGLNARDVKKRIDQFVDRLQGQDEGTEPTIVILAARSVPFFRIVEIYNYCVETKGLNYVSLNIAETRRELFNKVIIKGT